MKTRLALVVLFTGCSPDSKVGFYNVPPSVGILSPPDESVVDEGITVTFEALVDDDFDAPEELNVVWSSDRDGEFQGDFTPGSDGIAQYSTSALSVGNHTITIRVVDSNGDSARDSIGLTVNDVPDAPDVTVVHPASGGSGVEGEDFEFVITVKDAQDAPSDIALVFSSDVDGDFCGPTADGIGVAKCDAKLSGGDHVLTFTATDTSGLVTEEVVYFAVTGTEEVDDDEDGWTEAQGDCNDADSSVNPGAEEYYNGRDDDCNGLIDDGTSGYDDDGDGYSELDDDCDDDDPDVYPGAPELGNAKDDDCDGTVDEGTEYYDDDGDGYTEKEGDCDDASPAASPAGSEVADGLDNDCDGTVDEGTSAYDDDGDGYTEAAGDCDDTNAKVSPGATETCGTSYDDDCDGDVNDEGATSCTTFYYDYDGDSYGSSSISGKCLCSSTGYYTSKYNTDCYDSNANANPAVTTYYSTHRGDGSYDYNCDSSSSPYYTSTYDCEDFWAIPPCDFVKAGWYSGVASCGSSASYVTGCSVDWFTCDISTTTVVQTCR